MVKYRIHEHGNFYLFETKYEGEYLNFLENFDETKYEIIDSSTSMDVAHTSEFYMVTYKKIAE